MNRWLKASSIALVALLLAAALTGCAQPKTLTGGQWVSASGRTLAFREDGTADIQGLTANYEVKGSTILINSQPGFAELRWISDDEFTAKEVLSGAPGREQLFKRRR